MDDWVLEPCWAAGVRGQFLGVGGSFWVWRAAGKAQRAAVHPGQAQPGAEVGCWFCFPSLATSGNGAFSHGHMNPIQTRSFAGSDTAYIVGRHRRMWGGVCSENTMKTAILDFFRKLETGIE